MRVSFVVRVVAIVAVFTVSAVGQQTISLSIEPVRVPSVMTLADAVRHNNYPAFDAMFAASTGRESAAFAELHSFWKWSLDDKFGAFYGDEQHARFAAEYPDYANYIADFAIIDSHGRAFYPSAETRTFLLRKAETGAVSVVADGARASRPHVTAVPAVTRKAEVVAKPKIVAKAIAPKISVPKPVVVVEQPKIVAKPVVVTAKPVVVAAKPVVVAAKPVIIAPPQIVPARDAQPLRPGRPLSTGLVLIFVGLIALGMLSMLFRASSDEEPAEAHASHESMRIIPLDEKPKKTA